MPDLARNKRTGSVVDAREIFLSGEGLDDDWVCPGANCNADMKLIACDRDKKYEVSPHFRAKKPAKHAQNCSYDGLRKIVANGRVKTIKETMGIPEALPSVLRLASKRHQLPAQPTQVGLADESRDIYVGEGAGWPQDRKHESSASTLRRIAEAFCAFPLERDRPLRIPNLCQGTYTSCFQRIKHTSGFHKFENRIFYCPIRFTKPHRDTVSLTVELNAAVWPQSADENVKTTPQSQYRVSLLMDNWEDRNRNRFVADLNEAITSQREAHNKSSKWQVFAFFIGQQSPNDQALFVVNDHRLVCFLTVKENVLPD